MELIKKEDRSQSPVQVNAGRDAVMTKCTVIWICALFILSPAIVHPAEVAGAGAPQADVNDTKQSATRLVTSIHDISGLQAMSSNLNGSYILANDIDASETENWNGGAGFTPVGDSSGAYIPPMPSPPIPIYPNKFKGTFDGKGYKITGLHINRPSQDYVGLFGWAEAGTQFSNVSLLALNITGKNSVGGLAGETNGNASKCSSNGTVSGGSGVGGLMGRSSYSTISDCRSTATVSGVSYTGGLIGISSADLELISNCHSSGLVSGSSNNVGGLIGANVHSTITNSYSIATVNGASNNVGGLIGDDYYGIISNCFWDNQTSGKTTSAGGTGKNTTDMMKKATFTAWDFSSTWGILETKSYPFLMAFYNPPGIMPPEVLSTNEHSLYIAHCAIVYSHYPPTNNLTVWFSTNCTGWLSFNTTTGNLSGTSGNDDIGPHWVNITAEDSVGYNRSQNFTITVNNLPPAFTDVPPLLNTTVAQDQPYSFDVGCDDEGEGNTLYAFVTAPDWLSINRTTAVIAGTPGNKDVGLNIISIHADDGWGGRTNCTFYIMVTDVNDAPVIITDDLKTAKEGLPYTVVYQATDIDPIRETETFTWSLATNGSWLSLDSTSGLLSGTPDEADVGSWWVNVTVDDGRGGTDSHNFTVTVVNVNAPPKIMITPVTTATEGILYDVNFSATDPDAGDSLTWSLDGTADWLSINATTGVLSGIPGEQDVGYSWVTVTVADRAGANHSLSYMLQVQNVNDPPVWVSVPGEVNSTEGNMLFLDVLATDPDAGDSVSYAISSQPVAGISVNSASGAIRWMSSKFGSYLVNVTATDGQMTIWHVFNVTIRAIIPPPPPPTNNPPTIDPIGDKPATEGKPFALQITGRDPDSWDAKNLTFRLILPPAGMLISADGSLVWTPNKGQVGRHTLFVSLTDGKNSTTTTFVVNVAKGTTATGGKTEGAYSAGVLAGLAIFMLVLGLAVGAVIAYARWSKPPKEGAPTEDHVEQDEQGAGEEE